MTTQQAQVTAQLPTGCPKTEGADNQDRQTKDKLKQKCNKNNFSFQILISVSLREAVFIRYY
jgi:hypothetical protein